MNKLIEELEASLEEIETTVGFTEPEIVVNRICARLGISAEEFNTYEDTVREELITASLESLRKSRKRGAVTLTVAKAMNPELFNGSYETMLREKGDLSEEEIAETVSDRQFDAQDVAWKWQMVFSPLLTTVAIEDAILTLERANERRNLPDYKDEVKTESDRKHDESYNEGVVDTINYLKNLVEKFKNDEVSIS